MKNLRIYKAAALVWALCLTFAVCPIKSFAADAQQVQEMIAALPDAEDATEEDAPDVEKAMEEYRNLPMAERLEVENYEKLEDLYQDMSRAGYIEEAQEEVVTDEERAQEEHAQMSQSDSTETGKMEYVFAISDSSPTVSIVMHYITDMDGDGKGDIPGRIVLTSPTGVSTPITNATSGIKDDTMDITLTWEENFMQMDVAYAKNGNWEIITSDPVTFRRMPYAGEKQEIIAEGGSEESDEGVADVNIKPEEQEDKGGFGIFSIIAIVALLGVLAFLLKTFILGGDKNTEPKKKKENAQPDDAPMRESDEEVMRRLKQEMSRRNEEPEGQSEYLDDADLEETMKVEYDDDDLLEEYTEGETGLLRKSDNADDEDDMDSGFMDMGSFDM